MFLFLLPNYFVNQPSIHSSFQSLIMIQDGFALLPTLISILLRDLDVLSSILTSPLARIIARTHSATTDLSLACPLHDSCLLALDVSNMKSVQLVDQGVSSDLSNTKLYPVFPSFYYGFLPLYNADFKCSVKLSSQDIIRHPFSSTMSSVNPQVIFSANIASLQCFTNIVQSSTGSCNESFDVLLPDLPMYLSRIPSYV